MNKTDLIAAVAETTGLNKTQSGQAVDAVLDAVKNTLASGNDVTLVGFGTYKVTQRAARTGRNPSTGEALEIPASRTVNFKVGKALKDAVN